MPTRFTTIHRAHYYPETLQDALRLSTHLIEAGHHLDLGLMQINYEAWLRPTAYPSSAPWIRARTSLWDDDSECRLHAGTDPIYDAQRCTTALLEPL